MYSVANQALLLAHAHLRGKWATLVLQERDYRSDFFLDQTPSGDPEWELEKGLKFLRVL
jgi:hypothetical protein